MIIVLALFAFYEYIYYIPDSSSHKPSITKIESSTTHNTMSTNKPIVKTHSTVTHSKSSPTTAFKNHWSRVQVEGSGTVSHIFRDDTKGSRHQKFILKLSSSQTLLVAHNIDLAPRLNGISKGDTVQFYGQYEWNPKGGVLHWTHHDPKGRHKSGWLNYNGRTYQ